MPDSWDRFCIVHAESICLEFSAAMHEDRAVSKLPHKILLLSNTLAGHINIKKGSLANETFVLLLSSSITATSARVRAWVRTHSTIECQYRHLIHSILHKLCYTNITVIDTNTQWTRSNTWQSQDTNTGSEHARYTVNKRACTLD